MNAIKFFSRTCQLAGSSRDSLPRFIAKMRSQLWLSSSVESHHSELEKFIEQKDFCGWIALEGQQHIGLAEAYVRPFANGCTSQPVIFLEGVWVAPSYRQKRVGLESLTAVEKWARAKGIMEIGSDAELDNELSHLCHKHWGFEETERVIYYRKVLV